MRNHQSFARARIVPASPNCSRRRSTASGSPRTRRNAPSPSLRSSSTVQVAKICPRSFCADQGRKSSASTRPRWKNATIASCSLATSPSLFALITMQPGYFARNAVSSPPRSILLKTRRRGTSCAPISASTFSVTASCRPNPASLASPTWRSSDASSASSSVDLNEATSPCGRFLMKPTVSLTRSEEHTSELQSHHDLVCRLLLEKKKKQPDSRRVQRGRQGTVDQLSHSRPQVGKNRTPARHVHESWLVLHPGGHAQRLLAKIKTL